MEIRYELYNPTIREIEVLRLEKRLDEHLYYLRDAEPEFSTFPFDMDPEPHPEGAPVPVNPIKVRMKPWPWSARWEVQIPLIRGFEKLENVPDWYYNRSRASHNKLEKYDLMLGELFEVMWLIVSNDCNANRVSHAHYGGRSGADLERRQRARGQVCREAQARSKAPTVAAHHESGHVGVDGVIIVKREAWL